MGRLPEMFRNEFRRKAGGSALWPGGSEGRKEGERRKERRLGNYKREGGWETIERKKEVIKGERQGDVMRRTGRRKVGR